MPIVMQTNVASLQAQQNLNRSQHSLSTSFNKLSSGFRINSAADDAAGLSISENMRAQVRSYAVAERNANDAISMAQTAEGALGEVSGIIVRMRELAMQGANGALQTTDRGYLDTEFQSLKAEIQRIQGSTTFNGINLMTVTASTVDYQVGINTAANNRITLTFGGLNLSSLLSSSSTLAGTAGNSRSMITAVDNALEIISTSRARYGAAMNRLEVTTSNIETIRTNTSAADSRIRDVDVAEETSTMSRNQVLTQAGAAVLAQANQIPQIALNLLK
jgi:flagellin